MITTTCLILWMPLSPAGPGPVMVTVDVTVAV